VQLLAACEQSKERTPTIDLDVLADFPAVESVIASTRVRASRELPNIRELLLCTAALCPTCVLCGANAQTSVYPLVDQESCSARG